MKKERLINIRFLFCVFLGLMIGIIISNLFLIRKINIFILILILLAVAGVSILGFFYGKKTHKHNMQFKARRNVSDIIKFSSIGFGVACIIGILISIMPIVNLAIVKNYDGELTISGTACDYVDNEETYKKFILTDCKIIDSGVKEELDYEILIYTNSQTNIELGDKVTFSGVLSKFKVTDDYGLNMLINNIAYSTYVNSADMIISDGNISVRDFVHNRVYDLLSDNLNSENANICYAILFGDKQGLDDGISQMFSYAGISHILAVSGLHISVLVAVIWFVLDKLKINKYVKLGVFAGILLFYAYLCSFSPSVCRAGIMALLLAICKTFMWEYDALSSLSMAGIIILLLNPLMLFSLSFQLSFMCIFAIISFAPCLEYALKKIKCPNFLADSLAISIALNIAILPICMNSFGKVSLLGIISNIFVLPIFSVVYVLLFTVVLIGVIIKPLGVLLAIPNLFLHLIKVVANYVGSLPFGVFKVFNISYWLLVLIVLTTLIIHFVMSRHLFKSIAVAGLTMIIGLMLVLNTIPTKYDGNNMLVCTQYNSNVAICVSDNEVSLIGSDISYKTLLFLLKDARINKIDKVYAYDLQLNNINELISICKEFKVDTVYIPSNYDYEEIKECFQHTELLDIYNSLGEMDLNLIEYREEIIAVSLNLNNEKILIPNLSNNKTENNYLIKYYLDTNYIIVDDNEIWNDIDFDGIIHKWCDKSIIIKG